MAVKIIIQRNIPEKATTQTFPFLMKLREMAMRQDGYISGETLRNFDDPKDYLVISTWRSVDDWKAWESNQVRKDIQASIDEILQDHTRYKIYQYV
jgi:heme oxygenase (mycobilin-producing)